MFTKTTMSSYKYHMTSSSSRCSSLIIFHVAMVTSAQVLQKCYLEVIIIVVNHCPFIQVIFILTCNNINRKFWKTIIKKQYATCSAQNQFNDFHEHQLWNEFYGQSINTRAEICMYFSHIRASLWGHVSPGINGDSASVNRSRWTPSTYRTTETKLYKQKNCTPRLHIHME